LGLCARSKILLADGVAAARRRLRSARVQSGKSEHTRSLRARNRKSHSRKSAEATRFYQFAGVKRGQHPVNRALMRPMLGWKAAEDSCTPRRCRVFLAAEYRDSVLERSEERRVGKERSSPVGRA